MMAEAGDDLAWDYTGDESSPLLQRGVSPMYSGESSCGISRRQARYLLHSVTEAARILRGELNRERFLDIPPTRDYNIGSRLSTQCHRFMERISVQYIWHISLAIIFIVVLTIITETVWDIAGPGDHKPVFAAATSGISLVILVIFYAVVVWQAARFAMSISLIAMSFICSILVFAMVYVVFLRYKSLSLTCGVSASNDEIFVAVFCRSLEFSVSIFTLNSSGHYETKLWYTQLILSLQMISAYCHIVILLTILVLCLPVVTPAPRVPGGEPASSYVTRYDTDNDSIGPYDSRPINDRPVVTSSRTPETPIPQRHDNALDLCVSQSI